MELQKLQVQKLQDIFINLNTYFLKKLGFVVIEGGKRRGGGGGDDNLLASFISLLITLAIIFAFANGKISDLEEVSTKIKENPEVAVNEIQRNYTPEIKEAIEEIQKTSSDSNLKIEDANDVKQEVTTIISEESTLQGVIADLVETANSIIVKDPTILESLSSSNLISDIGSESSEIRSGDEVMSGPSASEVEDQLIDNQSDTVQSEGSPQTPSNNNNTQKPLTYLDWKALKAQKAPHWERLGHSQYTKKEKEGGSNKRKSRKGGSNKRKSRKGKSKKQMQKRKSMRR